VYRAERCCYTFCAWLRGCSRRVHLRHVLFGIGSRTDTHLGAARSVKYLFLLQNWFLLLSHFNSHAVSEERMYPSPWLLAVPQRSAACILLLARWGPSCLEMLSLSGVRGSTLASVEAKSLFWLSRHRPTKGMSLLSTPLVRISATFWELGGKRPAVGVCLTGSDNSSCLPGDDYQPVNLPNSSSSSHLFLDKRESARYRGNVIVSEAGILLFCSLTLQDGKAPSRDPCLQPSLEKPGSAHTPARRKAR